MTPDPKKEEYFKMLLDLFVDYLETNDRRHEELLETKIMSLTFDRIKELEEAIMRIL